MRLLRRLVAISPVALPALALVAYFALMPVPPAYAEKPVLCYYAGKGYSGGANIADNCSGGESHTCGAGGWLEGRRSGPLVSVVRAFIASSAAVFAISLMLAKGPSPATSYCTLCLYRGQAFSAGAHTMIDGVRFECTARGWVLAASCGKTP